MEAEDLVGFLLSRGDLVVIEHGRLRLEPVSGEPVPDEWLDDHQDKIISEIIKRTGTDAFTYESYSTGSYGECRAGGVTLQLISVLAEAPHYAIFNADLTRKKSTQHGKAGTPLPDRHFRVGRRHLFYKFWLATGLTIPRRLSSFHDYMDKLRGILFTGDYIKGGRLKADSIQPLSITHQQLRTAFCIPGLPDKPRTTPGHSSDNSRTRVPDKHSPLPHAQQAVQPITTTGENNHGTSKQGNAGIRGNVFPLNNPKSLEEQSVDEWLDGYGSDSFKGESDKT